MQLYWRPVSFVLMLTVLSCYGQDLREQAIAATLKIRRLPDLSVCGRKYQSLGNKVINGEPAKLGEYPWMANLGYRRGGSQVTFWGCAGSLISEQYVITAAHCLVPSLLNGYRLHTVRLGELDLDEDVDDGASPVDLDFESTIYHEDYKNAMKLNDVGLVKLKEKVSFTEFISPICLPPPEFRTSNFVGYRPIVAGWGKSVLSSVERQDTRLLMKYTEIKDLDECRENVTAKLKNVVINDKVFCAQAEDGGTCQGDSGGPVMFYKRLKTSPARSTGNVFLMGIVSYGHGCARQGFPSVYTRVSQLMPWIIENLDI